MSFTLQPIADPPFVTCKSCDGRGYTSALRWGVDPDWCPECGGAKEVALCVLQTAMTTLAHNLAIAAALYESFRLGGAYHVERYIADWNGGGWTYPFHPGCGKAWEGR